MTAKLVIDLNHLSPIQVARIAHLHAQEGGNMSIEDGTLSCDYALVPLAILEYAQNRAKEFRNIPAQEIEISFTEGAQD